MIPQATAMLIVYGSGGLALYIIIGVGVFYLLDEKLNWSDSDANIICALGWPLTLAFWIVIGWPIRFIMRSYIRMVKGSRRRRTKKTRIFEVK